MATTAMTTTTKNAKQMFLLTCVRPGIYVHYNETDFVRSTLVKRLSHQQAPERGSNIWYIFLHFLKKYALKLKVMRWKNVPRTPFNLPILFCLYSEIKYISIWRPSAGESLFATISYGSHYATSSAILGNFICVLVHSAIDSRWKLCTISRI